MSKTKEFTKKADATAFAKKKRKQGYKFVRQGFLLGAQKWQVDYQKTSPSAHLKKK